MPTVDITGGSVNVRLSVAEKIAGILRDLVVPVSAVRDVHVVPDGLDAVRGLRAPGLHLPGLTKYGTWRGPRGKTFVAVARRGPALVLHLDGHDYERVVVTADGADEVVERLRG